ncbi:MAG: hypothetical protein PHD56_08435 [Anaerostipes sp.]|nr:hypothetical protein [Anaerostipes sp.]
MSFTGIFSTKDGLVALADSKGSIHEGDKLTKDISRTPQKLFAFPSGVAVTYGANQFLLQNPNQIFSKKINIEDFVLDYLSKHITLDSNFFEDLLVKMGSSSSNQPVNFIVGRKIREGEYRLEHHQVGFDHYVQKIASNGQWYFIGGDELYVQTFHQMDLLKEKTSASHLQSFLSGRLQMLIQFYDDILSYNSVGGSVQSFIFR